MVLAAKFAREQSVPYLGICLGMQVRPRCFGVYCSHLCRHFWQKLALLL